MPSENLEILPNGQFSVCCLSKYRILKEDGNPFQYGNDSVTDVLKASHLKDFQNKFLNDGRPNECKTCWVIEANGGDSKRIIENNRFNTPSDTIRTLDLKPGNICNLKCRICSSYASSRWISDEIKLIGHSHFPLYNWPEVYGLKDLYQLAEHLEYIEISGGEPFMIDSQKQFIKWIVTAGYAKNINLQYHTNGTIFPWDIINELAEFKKVNISLSIDGIGDRFEYLRHPAKWDEVYTNWKLYKSISEFTIGISHSVNALNIYYIPEFIKFANMMKTNVYWNLVHNVMPATALSPNTIDKLINHFKDNLPGLLTYQVNPLHPHDNWLYTYLKSNYTLDNTKYIINRINEVDKLRKEDYKSVFPEMYELLSFDE